MIHLSFWQADKCCCKKIAFFAPYYYILIYIFVHLVEFFIKKEIK